MEALTVSEAAEIVGMTPGQVSNMIFHGPIQPEFHVPDGSGDQAKLGERNIKELRLISKMKQAGLKQPTIRDIIELLAKSQMKWWKGEGNHVVVLSDKWFVTDNILMNVKRHSGDGFMLIFRLD